MILLTNKYIKFCYGENSVDCKEMVELESTTIFLLAIGHCPIQ